MPQLYGRTVLQYSRVYVDGYDLSGFTRSYGPLTFEFQDFSDAALTDGVKNSLAGQPQVGAGTVNAFLDNVPGGLHDLANGGEALRTVAIAIGIRQPPFPGDPVFLGQFSQTSYQAEPNNGRVTVSMAFSNTDTRAQLVYPKPWGVLLHANNAETTANVGGGVDNGAATARGGYLHYQLLASDGSVTLLVEDSADDLAYSPLSGATSGVLASAPASGQVTLATNAAVGQYLRWQITLGTATTATFVLAFVRG